MFIGTLIDKVKFALQNHSCQSCGQKPGEGGTFCKRCREKLKIRLPEPILETPLCAIHAATDFNPALKRILYGHKFYNRTEHVPQLSGILTDYWSSLPPCFGFSKVHPENVLVMPIPPHRGNVSLIDRFAGQFARHFGYDYRHDALTWTREVKAQHRIHDRRHRLDNIASSLHLKSGIVAAYEKIIIVDDITTTGATLLEASRAFRSEAANRPERDRLVCLAITRIALGEQVRAGEVE